MRVTSRQIAKILIRALPLDDDEIADKIQERVKEIEAMPEQTRLALQSAYIFSSKVPKEEQEDFFQELVLAILEQKREIKTEAFVYQLGKWKWLEWLNKQRTRQKHPATSLNEVAKQDQDREIELGEKIIGMDDLEDKVIARVEAQRIYREAPRHIKLIVKKRLRDEPLSPKEKAILSRFRTEIRSNYQLKTPPKCSIDGCERHSFCRGYCEKHYRRWYKTGSPMGLLGRSSTNPFCIP